MQNSKQFIIDEVKEIKKYLKEREKAGEAITESTIHKWVEKNSEDFRKKWQKSHS